MIGSGGSEPKLINDRQVYFNDSFNAQEINNFSSDKRIIKIYL